MDVWELTVKEFDWLSAVIGIDIVANDAFSFAAFVKEWHNTSCSADRVES